MYLVSKRMFDVVVALLLILPILGICAVFGGLFTLTTGERPIFRQRRTGLGNRPFLVYKLKTMTEERNDDGELLPDDDRLTSLGRIMRRYSIDELPQIVNVLRSEMSLVGPRPQVDEFLHGMSERERERHKVLPGITGWAQVNGRNASTWDERFGQDLWYVDNASFWLDLRIIAMTPMALLKADGISHDGHATMPRLVDVRSTTRPEPANADDFDRPGMFADPVGLVELQPNDRKATRARRGKTA